MYRNYLLWNQVYTNKIKVLSGIPQKTIKSIKNIKGKYNLTVLHDLLINLIKKNLHENTIIIEPIANIEYEALVLIMDSVRILYNTDPALFTKDKENQDKKVLTLFDDIVFGNIKS